MARFKSITIDWIIISYSCLKYGNMNFSFEGIEKSLLQKLSRGSDH